MSEDWDGKRAGIYARKYLVVSPDSQNTLLGMIRGASKLDIETEELGDDKAVIEALGSKGKKARIILPSSISPSDKQNVRELMERNVNIRYAPAEELYMHAKMINTGRTVFIGSQNFSSTSLMKNREVGIIIRKGGLKRFATAHFSSDWKKSYEPGKKPKGKKN